MFGLFFKEHPWRIISGPIILFGAIFNQIIQDYLARTFLSLTGITEGQVNHLFSKLFIPTLFILFGYWAFIIGKDCDKFFTPRQHLNMFIDRKIKQGNQIRNEGDDFKKLYIFWKYNVKNALENCFKINYRAFLYHSVSAVDTNAGENVLREQLRKDIEGLEIIRSMMTSDWIMDGYNPKNLKEY